MKTTIEIPQTLLDEARKLASHEGTTLRALVEEGLRRIIAERRRAGAFRLRKATFKGTGLQAGVAGTPWERIRDMAYEGRGG
jgi:Bacterial antitoxin of type II TA system, VapB